MLWRKVVNGLSSVVEIRSSVMGSPGWRNFGTVDGSERFGE